MALPFVNRKWIKYFCKKISLFQAILFTAIYWFLSVLDRSDTRGRILRRNWDKRDFHLFLLLIHFTPPPPPLSKSGLKLVCNVNFVYGNLKSENSQDYAQKPERNCTFMNSASAYQNQCGSDYRTLNFKIQDLDVVEFHWCGKLTVFILFWAQVVGGGGGI